MGNIFGRRLAGRTENTVKTWMKSSLQLFCHGIPGLGSVPRVFLSFLSFDLNVLAAC